MTRMRGPRGSDVALKLSILTLVSLLCCSAAANAGEAPLLSKYSLCAHAHLGSCEQLAHLLTAGLFVSRKGDDVRATALCGLQVLAFVVNAVKAEAFNEKKTLFLFGSYTVGKEKLFLEVARSLQQKVRTTASQHQWTWSQMLGMLGVDATTHWLHVCMSVHGPAALQASGQRYQGPLSDLLDDREIQLECCRST